MPNPKPKTNAQVRRMFGLAKPLAEKADMKTDEYLRMILGIHSDKLSIAAATFDEANVVIKALGGDPFSARGNSVRMQNYRKQAAGIKTIETEAHLTKIRDTAAIRGMGEEGIGKLATRMRLPWPPKTTEQGNKILEALKKMNQRDGLVAFPKSKGQSAKSSATEPNFRRVA